jgi:hypothetical protein
VKSGTLESNADELFSSLLLISSFFFLFLFLFTNQFRAKSVNVEEVAECIFMSTVLPVPLPLSQMVDILVDCWEADGLYD